MALKPVYLIRKMALCRSESCFEGEPEAFDLSGGERFELHSYIVEDRGELAADEYIRSKFKYYTPTFGRTEKLDHLGFFLGLSALLRFEYLYHYTPEIRKALRSQDGLRRCCLRHLRGEPPRDPPSTFVAGGFHVGGSAACSPTDDFHTSAAVGYQFHAKSRLVVGLRSGGRNRIISLPVNSG